MIEDIENWNAKTDGNTLVVSGPISAGGIRRSLSVLELPASLASAMDVAGGDGSSQGDANSLARLASQQYYKSIEALLEDLRDEKRDKKTYTAGSVALWYDKYARKIDNLPILNVDDDLLSYGSDVAELLRGGETALKGVGMRTSLRTGENDGNTGYNSVYGYQEEGSRYGGYGGYGGYRSGYAVGYTNPYYANREKGRSDMLIRSQEQTRGAASAQAMWMQIDKATADIRRVMTQKYKSEF